LSDGDFQSGDLSGLINVTRRFLSWNTILASRDKSGDCLISIIAPRSPLASMVSSVARHEQDLLEEIPAAPSSPQTSHQSFLLGLWVTNKLAASCAIPPMHLLMIDYTR